jgi:hypothetical protein
MCQSDITGEQGALWGASVLDARLSSGKERCPTAVQRTVSSGLRGPCRQRALRFAQPVGVAFEHDHLAVVQHAVQDG